MRIAPLGQTYQHLGELWMWFSRLELWTNSQTGSMRASWMQKNSQQAALPLACTASPRSGVFEEKAGKSVSRFHECWQLVNRSNFALFACVSAITNVILIDLILGFGTLTNWLWKKTEKASIQLPNRPWNPHIAKTIAKHRNHWRWGIRICVTKKPYALCPPQDSSFGWHANHMIEKINKN